MLVVDDNDTNRFVLAQQLGSWGVTHETASGAREAVEKIEEAFRASRPFDVLLLDMQMPETDGLMLWQSVRGGKACERTKAIILSSDPVALSAVEMTSEKVEACLLKPVRQSRLFETLRQLRGDASQPAEAVVPVPAGAAAGDAPTMRILVAEDNVVNQKVVLAQLKKLGFAADAVANGLEALDALARIPYDLVLMDCQMPEMDGYEASRMIREGEREHAGRRTRIVALTASAIERDRQRCLDAGMDDYLAKLVKIEALDATLRRSAEVMAP
jgi:CheY-like chemotaxis protein